SYVDELAGQVTGVSCTQSSVGAALAGSVRRDEVLEHVEALTEVSADRQLDGVTRGVRHQATHTGQLSYLLGVTTGARLRHDEERVERHVRLEVLEHSILHLLGGVVPQLDHLLEPLVLGGEAALEALVDLVELDLGSCQQFLLLGRDGDVVDTDGDTRLGRQLEPVLLETVEESSRALRAEALEALDDQVAKGAAFVDRVVAQHLLWHIAASLERLP